MWTWLTGRGRRRERGNYSVMFVLLVPITMGFCALSVDLSYMQFTKMQLQHVADAASHAALVRYRQTNRQWTAKRAARDIVAANLVGSGHARLDKVEFGRFENGRFRRDNRTINSARAWVSRKKRNSVKLFFAPFLNVFSNGRVKAFEIFEPSTNAITTGHTREICIAQDITGSFRDDIGFARQADLAFLDFLKKQPFPGDKIAMSTFVGGVAPRIWTPLTDIKRQYREVSRQWTKLDSCNCNVWHWWYGPNWCKFYYGNYNEQPWMQDCFQYGSQTAQGPGINQCMNELNRRGNPTAFQAIIVISDGLPCCDHLTWSRRRDALRAADQAWRHGIHVWSVAYMNGGGDFRFLQDLVRGYGVAFETPDPSELEGIMVEIAQSIPIVLVD